MEEIQVLAMLIQHADRQIDSSVNTFLMLMGIMATLTMTKAYEEKFNVFLKVLLSVGLTVVLWSNRDAIIAQMEIYNALIENFPDEEEPWATLFGDHSVYHMLSVHAMFWVHAAASWLVHVLVWHKELKDKVGGYIMRWWRNRKARRKQLTGR